MKSPKPLVSVIIPIYNAQATISKCLDSLVRQSLQSIELVLVDDGSKDRSPIIISKYQKKYKNIRYYKQVNGGVASARNLGLTKANGQYIGFCDADDSVDPNMYQKMAKAMTTNIDLVFCGRYDIYNKKSKQKIIYSKDKVDPKKFNQTSCYVWDKLYKKELIDKHDICFPIDINYAEDFYFLTLYKIYANKMITVREPLYFHDKARDKSITNQNNMVLIDIIKSLSKLNDYLITNKLFNTHKKELLICSAGFYLRRLREFKQYNNLAVKIRFTTEFFKYFEKYFEDWKKAVNHYKSSRNNFQRTNKLIVFLYIIAYNFINVRRAED